MKYFCIFLFRSTFNFQKVIKCLPLSEVVILITLPGLQYKLVYMPDVTSLSNSFTLHTQTIYCSSASFATGSLIRVLFERCCFVIVTITMFPLWHVNDGKVFSSFGFLFRLNELHLSENTSNLA